MRRRFDSSTQCAIGLAHDPRRLANLNEQFDLDRLESGLSKSQQELVSKLRAAAPQPDEPEDTEDVRRLSAIVLALLTEIEQHRQWHVYWRENKMHLDTHGLLVALSAEQLGMTPMSAEEYLSVSTVCLIPQLQPM